VTVPDDGTPGTSEPVTGVPVIDAHHGLSQAERDAIFSGTARRTYALTQMGR